MRKMKDSGVEWIGIIPETWNRMKFKRIIDMVVDNRGKTPPLSDDGIPMVEMDSLTNLYPDINRVKKFISQETYDSFLRKYLEPGDILFATVGSIGKTSLVPENVNFCIAQNIVGYRIKKGYDNHFWFHYINSGAFKDTFIQYNKGNIQDSIKISDLREGYIVTPNLSEQQKIATYLDQKVAIIDNIIEKTKQSIDEYKKYKQSLITETVTKGLNPNVKMKDSGIEWIGEIPEHWEVVNPKRLFDLRKEKAFEDDEQLTASQKHGILPQKDFMEIESQKVVTVEKDFSILKHVEPNDFVISMRSFQGGLEYSSVRGCISSAYVMIIPKQDVYPPFFRWLFKSEKYINALQSTSNLVRDGQAMRFSNFIQIPLFQIPNEEQKTIADFLDIKTNLIDQSISTKESLLSELEAYKKSLIYEVVTGKKEV